MNTIQVHYPQAPSLPFATDSLTKNLAQARAHKETKPEQADRLYTQVEDTLLKLVEEQGVKPSDLAVLLTDRDESETLEQSALRQLIAEVYFEHGAVFDRLKQTDSAQACYQQAQAWGHPDAAMQLNRGLPVSGPRFSLGRRPVQSAHDVHKEPSAKLLELLKDQSEAVVEISGPPGVGKTMLLQRLMHPRLDPLFASYDLIGWVDCSSVSSAHEDIQAISYALGHGSLDPQSALKKVANYVQQHPHSLLILDGLAPSNVDFVLSWLKSSLGSAQLIYTTTRSLTDQLSPLGRSVELLPLSPLNADQAQNLVQQCLPKESLEAGDFAQLILLTEGYPGVIQALCGHYQTVDVGFRNFADFLAQPVKHQGVRESLLNEIARASLASLETEAQTNPVTARALMLLKQAAGLGENSIPFAFFVNEHRQVDLEAIQTLRNKQLAIVEIDRATQSLKLNSVFLSGVQNQYLSEQRSLLEKNIQRLSEVFSYLTDNESTSGRQSQPEDLKPYADLVHTLLFKTCAGLSENLPLLNQVLTLGSSLARLYYQYHGELKLAYECLQRAQHFFKQGLSKELIAQFEQAPKDFTAQSPSEEEAALLKLYAQEYLYQSGTLASQLVSRGQVAVEVMQDFETSYAIQVNLGEAVDPEAIAYTLRNFTRALRKQGRLLDALEEYQKLTEWLDQHSAKFDERRRAELLVDQGIIQKEVEDGQPEDQRNYQAALDLLCETQRIYLKHEAQNQRQALGMLSIYLGETYLANQDFESGVTHTCQILHYDGKRQERQARAYFILARAFDEAEYGALAKLFIDLAAPLQIKAYQPTTEALRIKIEQKLLQRHKRTTSHSGYASTARWEKQANLTEYCEKQLVTDSAPSKRISRAQIQALETAAYGWLWQHHSDAEFDAKEAELAEKSAELDAQEKKRAKKHEQQREREEQWYRTLAQRIDLKAQENKQISLFAEQFKEALLYQMVQQLRHANGEPMPMGKAELTQGLIDAFSGLLPEIQLDVMGGSITAAVDLAALVQGVTKTLSERQRMKEKAEAQQVADALAAAGQKPKSLQVRDRIEQQIEEMANYAARCWQPVLSAHTWPINDIEKLAEYGARRVMDYLKIGRAGTLSSQEQVVFALMTGEASTSLTRLKGKESKQPKKPWSVQGFFAKPGLRVEAEDAGQAMYLLSQQALPSVYGYRLGSPLEARTRPYDGPFKSEADAQRRAEEARQQQNRCLVM
ncbi:NACHT domain-containing protein [Mycoavidus sp. HKI]|uniref:NACHT domain-containing protein n=1 Tax=Mycoavidus sp. HKI TaxID=2840467 RepID=UPI001CBFD665|nr:NACHT domain-containing protein [Mycoavidus sp. HKI]UAW63918.1 NACHT domain-containing protein [Mycoavidus sp. HKI]